MVDQVVTTDAWLVQAVGGSTQYGNGTGGLTTIGPAPPASSGSPNWKGRGVYEVDLTTVLSGATGIASALFSVVVAGTSCIGSRGGTIRILLEELTTSFGQKSATGDCGFSSGSGTGVWAISNNVNTADSAFHSSGAHSAGDVLTWDIAALMARKLAEGATVLRFRLIAASSDGSTYDEGNTARRITVYSVRDGTAGNRPKISVTTSVANITKSASDSFGITESSSIVRLGAGSVTAVDDFSIAESAVVSTSALYEIVADVNANGVGQITLPSSTMDSLTLLPDVTAQDVLVQCQFKLLTTPTGGSAVFRLIARAIDQSNYYRTSVVITGGLSASLKLQKIVGGGVNTTLAEIDNLQTILLDEWYWLQIQLTGVSPTSLVTKIWANSDGIAPNWQVSDTDSEAILQAAGKMGMGFRNGSVNISALPTIFQVDNFGAVAA